MQVEIGQVYEGVVKGITPYGAFVDLAEIAAEGRLGSRCTAAGAVDHLFHDLNAV